MSSVLLNSSILAPAGGGGSTTVTLRPTSGSALGYWTTPPTFPANWTNAVEDGNIEAYMDAYIDLAFDTTVVPSGATITEWLSSIDMGVSTSSASQDVYWVLMQAGVYVVGYTSGPMHMVVSSSTVPTVWRSTALTLSCYWTNNDFDYSTFVYFADPYIEITYTT